SSRLSPPSPLFPYTTLFRSLEVRAVLIDPIADEGQGGFEQRVRTQLGDGLARIALVSDPDVAVIVVTVRLRTLRQGHGGGCDHAVVLRCQAGQDGIRLQDVRVRAGAIDFGDRPAP